MIHCKKPSFGKNQPDKKHDKMRFVPQSSRVGKLFMPTKQLKLNASWWAKKPAHPTQNRPRQTPKAVFYCLLILNRS